MLRHDDKSDHTEPIPIPHLLQNLKQKIAVLGCAQQRLAIAATPGDEVQCSSLMEALQAPRHAFKVESRDLLVCDPDSEKRSRFLNAEALSRSPGCPTSGRSCQKWGFSLEIVLGPGMQTNGFVETRLSVTSIRLNDDALACGTWTQANPPLLAKPARSGAPTARAGPA